MLPGLASCSIFLIALSLLVTHLSLRTSTQRQRQRHFPTTQSRPSARASLPGLRHCGLRLISGKPETTSENESACLLQQQDCIRILPYAFEYLHTEVDSYNGSRQPDFCHGTSSATLRLESSDPKLDRNTVYYF